MPITTGRSTKELADAVADLKRQCTDADPRVVIFFGSARYEAAALSRQMREAFPGACTVGCSTAGEIAAGEMLTGSVVAMFLGRDVVAEAACVAVEKIGAGLQVQPALRTLERHFAAPLASLAIDEYVGVVLADGLSGAEERLMEQLGDAADVFFVGGSAGDDLKFQRTHVFENGNCYTDAAVLLLLRLPRGFEIVKTQSFRPTGKVLVATKVDQARRKVIEFDHRPALDAYAAALGVNPEDAAAQFFQHPLGLMANGEPFVRSPQHVEDGSIVFYCQVKQGMELALLEATDIVADTRAAIEAKMAQWGPIAGLIDFQCILRTLQLRNEKRCSEYGKIFSGMTMAGFSTYGEAYLGHINQTSTILMFR
ncbi:MAG TPA: FIST N-terminal domain-containing protein [Bryobacteraceae bacterium]|nr:FIST N-terminal domain-containing protein [Bryobacteraceae bacterium]